MLRQLLIALAVVAGCAAEAWAQPSVERGNYLVNNIGACSNCHTPRLTPPTGPNLELRLSGGFQTFNEPFFTVKGSNLTPDRDTGLGAWSDADIKRALTEGVRPNGVPLAMVMPFSFLRVHAGRSRRGRRVSQDAAGDPQRGAAAGLQGGDAFAPGARG